MDKVYTVEELLQYDGEGPDGILLVGLNGKVYDVTEGKKFYGKGGPYEVFAGKDATRGLSSFNMVPRKGQNDLDLSKLEVRHYRNCMHWVRTFSDKYPVAGSISNGAVWNASIKEAYEESLKDGEAPELPPQMAFQSTSKPAATLVTGESSTAANNQPAANQSEVPKSRDKVTLAKVSKTFSTAASFKRKVEDLGDIMIKDIEMDPDPQDNQENNNEVENGDAAKNGGTEKKKLPPTEPTIKHKRSSRLCKLL